MTLFSLFRKPASPLSRGLRLLQLVAVLALVGLVSTVAAAPAVTSATCANSAGYCATGATVVFTGTELTSTIAIGFTAADQAATTCAVTASSTTSVTCTLTTSDRGEYPIYISGTYVGNLLMGTFYEQQGLESNPFNNTGVETQYFVAAQSSGTPANGENFTLYGNFSKDTTYEIYFFNDEKIISMSSPGLPLCHSVVMDTDYHNELTCVNLTTTAEKMGAYGILVKDLTTYRYLPGSAQLDAFVIYTPNATVSSVTGDCATNSSKCVTGAILTFAGKDLNVRVPSNDPAWSFYIKLSIGYLDEENTITCAVTAVSGTGDDGTVSCNLTIGDSTMPGNYPIYVHNMIQHRGIYAPAQHIGNLLYGDYFEWYPAGFNTGALPTDTEYRVTGMQNDTYVGELLTIYGFFPGTGDNMEVQFYNTEQGSAAYTANLPTCVLPTLTTVNVDTTLSTAPNAITCVMRVDPTQMGAYRVMIKNATTGWYYRGSTTLTPFMVTRTPTVSSASGACATSSSSCVTGAAITFNGKEFNTVTPTAASGYSHYVSFRVGFTQSNDPEYLITCDTLNASGASLLTTQTVACELTIGSKVAYGMYPIYMINQITYSGIVDNGTHIGNLVYGTFPEWEPAGFSNATLPDDMGYMVTEQNGTLFDHLASMTIIGSFPKGVAMNIYFYNLDSDLEASNGGDISCRGVTLTAYDTNSDYAEENALTCSINTNFGKMGRYRFMVENAETGWMFPGSAYLEPITINHNDPHIKSATFTCPNSATSCTTGGVLTLTGDHINIHTPPSASPYDFYTVFTIHYTDEDDDVSTTKITCTVTSVGGNFGTGYATCELTFDVTSPIPGTYPIYGVNFLNDVGDTTTPFQVGSLVIGKDGTVSTSNPWVSSSVTAFSNNVTALYPKTAPAGTGVTVFGNFNTTITYTVAFARVDGQTDSTPTCAVTAVTNRTITCTMATNSAQTDALFYPLVLDATNNVYLHTSFTDIHTLTLAGNSTGNTIKHDDTAFVATLAVMIVFIVLFVGMIVALIVICCCCECRRKNKRFNEFGDPANDKWKTVRVTTTAKSSARAYTDGTIENDMNNHDNLASQKLPFGY